MFVRSKRPVFARALVEDLFDTLSAVPGAALLATPFVKLFTANLNPPSRDSIPSDFTEAAFVGYAGIALSLPLIGPLTLNSNAVGGYEQVSFIAGAVVPPGENILGYYVVDNNAAPTKVYLSELFDAPIPIVALGDSIQLDVIFGVDSLVDTE